jgi:hypothetical protein
VYNRVLMIEHASELSAILTVLPIVALTVEQVRAIIARDDNRCLFPFQHNCHSKLTVHHIYGKEDVPENLATLCREAHYEILHSGAPEEDELLWEGKLSAIAQEQTTIAKVNGWIFPDNDILISEDTRE